MGYYRAGDYYRRGDAGSALARIGSGTSQVARRAWGSFFPGGGMVGTIAKGAVQVGKAILGEQYAISPHGGPWGGRRYRRMNPLNPRALRRALRRAEGFERFARRVIAVTHRGGRKKWKIGRRRRRHA